MRVFIYPNLLKTNSLRCAEQACGILLEEDCEIYMEESYKESFGEMFSIKYFTLEECVEGCDVIIVTGGDGTILRCSSAAARYGKPILGINCGTLGFMASLEADDLDKLRLLCRGEYTVTERMRLSVKVKCESGEEICADALNDVVLIKGENCRIADFEVSKSGSIVSSLRADGVIFSTATGATAYSLSAGGPIIEPDMECIEFSQICAHSLFARTIVFSPDSHISVRCRFKHDAYALLSADGIQTAKITDRDIVKIERSKITTKIIDLTAGSFFPTVNRKLMIPLKDTE
ncbi:MAG: NAD(+)/NADH kinase [Ruminococcus sp.]|nr:NAD(+)/NADH kinase [Ruminococcus sp.]